MTQNVHNDLDQLVLEPAKGFDRVFVAMTHAQRDKARGILIYVDKALDFLLARQSEGRVKGSHLHLPLVLPEQKGLVLEFLVIKLFFMAMDADDGRQDHIASKISALTTRLERNQLPENASAKNGGNREYKKWKKQWERLRAERTFLTSIDDPEKTLMPAVVINGQQNDLSSIDESLFTTSAERLAVWRSYVLLNENKFTKFLSDLAKSGVLQGIKTALLFDYDGRNIFNGCDINMLDRYHDSGVEIKDLIVVTFGREVFRLKQQINRCTSVYRRYFNQSQPSVIHNGSHVFDRQELEHLLHQSPHKPSVHWIGDRHNSLDVFLELTHTLDIGELRTIRVFNLFMIVMTPALSVRITKELFDEGIEEGLFRKEVREQISALSDEQKVALEQSVTALLTHIVSLWQTSKQRISEIAARNTVGFIVPFPLVNDKVFTKELSALLDGVRFKTYSWRDMKVGLICENVIITLNYKDTGRYPFDVFPSIMEHELAPSCELHALLIKMLFAKRFRRCAKEYAAAQNGMLKDLFRKRYLGWSDSDHTHGADDLAEEDIFEDIDDQEQDMHDPAELIRITYSDGEHSSFYPSKQLIVQREERFMVIRADQLSDKEIGSAIQPLDDIHEDLNLFEISREEESELERIKRDFGVVDVRAVLWKVLLKGKLGQQLNDQELYSVIAKNSGDPEFIRYQHFKNNWLDPGSKLLIPRKRRHFRTVCEYLSLPQSYYRLKLKKRASMTQNTRQSNQKKNRLLAQMFNEGSFDTDMDWSTKTFYHYLEPHDLEEHGMTEDNVNQEIRALTDLLKENIIVRTIQKIERP